jgi:hypothetical protein
VREEHGRAWSPAPWEGVAAAWGARERERERKGVGRVAWREGEEVAGWGGGVGFIGEKRGWFACLGVKQVVAYKRSKGCLGMKQRLLR